jgi:hypothetical protein
LPGGKISIKELSKPQRKTMKRRMERERSPWSIHRLSRRRHDRCTTPSPNLRKIHMKRQSID